MAVRGPAEGVEAVGAGPRGPGPGCRGGRGAEEDGDAVERGTGWRRGRGQSVKGDRSTRNGDGAQRGTGTGCTGGRDAEGDGMQSG